MYPKIYDHDAGDKLIFQDQLRVYHLARTCLGDTISVH